ncbi:hypothetical protein [Pantoea allii]|uniref:hypothetical protein n=1 Tax=Pantoea allii TaxID=574096 RepID=UPI0024B79298|nr:hypothetical protein [Pantoea allii]MDJ0040645.1 hypothetical protein [Pantoea allii]
MNAKQYGVPLLVSSLILGGAIFCAAMVNKGLILQEKHVIKTTSGSVNLGEIYSEKRGMDITIAAASDNAPKEINLTNLDPNNFSGDIHNALTKIANRANEQQGLSGDKAIKVDKLSSNLPFKLHVTTYIQYISEHIPNYKLVIEEKDFIIEKEVFEHRINTEAEKMVKESAPVFSANSFIKD